jgi:hypothetical protein
MHDVPLSSALVRKSRNGLIVHGYS